MAEQLTLPHGKTFTPCYFKEDDKGNIVRSNINWAGQQIFALDFDGEITHEQFISRCKRFGVIPAFNYSTFSSINNNKFRAIFVLEHEVTDFRVRNIVQFALQLIFKECDKSCKDGARMFFGGKEILFCEYTATINIPDLLKSLYLSLNTRDSSNASREMKTYCQSVGLNMMNGLPHVQVIDVEKDNVYDDFATNSIIYNYRSCPHFVNKFYVINFANDTEEVKARIKKSPKYQIESTKNNKEYIRNLDWSELYTNCKLYRDFSSGEYWAYHNELFGIASNLTNIQGGQQRFLESIKKREEYDVDKWHYYINYIHKSRYLPMRCENFCPFKDECEHTSNMIEQAKLPRGHIRIISEPLKKSLAEAETELKKAFKRIYEADDDKVYVIKSPTGIGKTELYLTLNNVLVAVPTHNLKEEVANRMKVKGNEVMVTPELPELREQNRTKLHKLFSTGNSKGAFYFIRQLAEQDDTGAVKSYLYNLEKAQTSESTVVTTHEKLFSFDTQNKKIIIIDEDIVPTMIKQSYVDFADLDCLLDVASLSGDDSIAYEIYNKVKNAKSEAVYSMPNCPKELMKEIENDFIFGREVSTNVLGFLNCDYFLKDKGKNGEVIHFVKKRQLPNSKLIILSATANETTYRLIFGNKLEFIDLGYVETVGNLIQYPQRSFSRYQIKQSEHLLKFAQPLIENKPVITYKMLENELSNVIATFGSVAGLDRLSGNDLVVLGTPHIHPFRYILFAYSVGLQPSNTDFKMQYTMINRNGYEFRFQTFSNHELLREIQLYLVESELEQAVGRARILRNDCTVTVFSNLPLQGATFKYVSNNQDNTVKLVS